MSPIMTNFTPCETRLMTQLIRSAFRYKGKTFPNPVVGAAVYHTTQESTPISTGFHVRYGSPHAETVALDAAGSRAHGAALMVTLSPCTHDGNTPPCVDAIIRAGISEVVIAVDDPNPIVKQRSSIQALKAAGINVRVGLCETEAIDSNAGFFSWMRKKTPYVHLKAGMSIDGVIALDSGESKYITSKSSLKQVHKLRREVQAIIVGIGTVLADQPTLNVRHGLNRKGYTLPRRVILDPMGKTPLDAAVLDSQEGGQSIVCVSLHCPADKKDALAQIATVWELPMAEYGLSWTALLSRLGLEGIQDILIEGGQKIFTSAISENIVKCCHLFMAPIILGSPGMSHPFNLSSIQSLSDGHRFARWQHQRCGTDLYVKGWLN